jgi:ankyrin repeat protein
MWCVMRNSVVTAKELIKHGADIDNIDIGGRTALQYAIIYGNSDMVAYLRSIARKPHHKRHR